jgi:ATP-binding cassette subfamily C protein CydC
MRSLFYFLPLFARLKGPLALSLLLSLVTLAAGIALLGISGWFLTAAALTTAGVAFNLFAPSAGVRGLSFVRILSRYGEKLTGHDATLRILTDLRRWMFARLFRLVPLGHRFGRADLVSRLVADLDALDTIFLVALGPILTAAIAGAGVSVLLGFLLPGAALPYAAGYFAVLIVVPTGLVFLSRRPSAIAVVASAALRRTVLDAVDGHQDLVVFDALGEAAAHTANASKTLAIARRRLGQLGAIASAAVQAGAGALLVVTLVIGLEAVHAERLDGAVFVGVLLAVVASFEAIAMLVRSATRLAAAAAAATRLVDIAEAPAAIADPANPVPLPPGGTIALENVSFGHDARAHTLDDVSVTIASGECVAIRGASGAGKSSLAQLLVRLQDPQAGRVRINGVDLRDVASASIRERIALMTQDAPVFNDSVRANLLIGRDTADDGALWAALETVGLGGAIRALPGGLDAVLGEAGRTLSAGQARRICLARTLLSGAPIIVLDEPTSGLDGPAEAQFLAELPAIAAGRTMIVITHADLPPGFVRVLTLQAGNLEAV